MNVVLVLALSLWLVRIAKAVRKRHAWVRADVVAENLARALGGQLARGLTGSEAVLSASSRANDRRTNCLLRKIQAQVALGKTPCEALASATKQLAGHRTIEQLRWFFWLATDSGANAQVLSQFADRVATERHRRSELCSQMLEARTTAVVLPIVAAVMAASIATANHGSRLVLATNLGVAVMVGAGLVVSAALVVVLRMTKI